MKGGRIAFDRGAVMVPMTPGLGVELDRDALATLHARYLECGVRNRDDLKRMQRYDPTFTGETPRF